MSSLRVLAVSSYFPFPEDRGDPIRVAMFMRCLNENTRLTVYAVRRPDTEQRDVEALRAQLAGSVVVTFDASRASTSRLAAARRWLSALRSRTPAWIAGRFNGELAKRVTATSATFDLVVLLGEAAGVYARNCSATRVHLDKANVLSRSTAADAAEAEDWRSRQRLEMIARVSRSYERRVLSRVDSVSVTSSEEARRLAEDYGRVPDLVLPSAITLLHHRPPFAPGGKYAVWLGSLAYRSNLVGLERFLSNGLGRLRDRGLTLLIAGSGGTASIEDRLRRTPGVEYRGFVEDLMSLVPEARAAVVPLWSGAGVKLKTLTLMNLGLPVVATTTAMEGISPEGALAVADDAASIALAVVEATDHELEAARSRAFAILERDFSAETFARRLSTALPTIGGL